MYGGGTTPNDDATADTPGATTLVVRAKYSGTWGNAIVSTETMANGAFGAATFAGGTDSTATLSNAAQQTQSAQLFVIAPARATHWYIYASSFEGDTLGLLLAEVAVTTMSYDDVSPMVGTTGSLFTNIERPLILDPPNGTKVMAHHKRRLWRRRETFLNFFDYSGYEEVKDGQAGSPYESYPGVNANTVSADLLNETSYPDESDQIRAMVSHGDALWIGTEDEVTPLYGESLETFSFSEIASFGVGMAGRNVAISTPFGLAFLSYDRKLYLYPSYAVPVNEDASTALVEISRPQRTEFEQIAASDLMQAHLVHYNWGKRNWLVLSYRREDATYKTWVFDWETKGWIELQRGCTALAVFEVSPGKKVLVGAGTDFNTYVLDDRTGTYAASGNFPVGTFRVLVDFGEPNENHVVDCIAYEKSNESLGVTVTYWLDPNDPDNPGTGQVLPMSKMKIGANRFEGKLSGGSSCQRILVEFSVAASTVSAVLRGIAVYAYRMENSRTK